MKSNKMKLFIVILIYFQIVNAAKILDKNPRNLDHSDATAFVSDDGSTANLKDSFFLNPLHWAAKKGKSTHVIESMGHVTWL